MESCNCVLKYVSIFFVFFHLSSSSNYATPISSFSPLEHVIMNTTAMHRNYTALSDFRLINRRRLRQCSASSSSVKIHINSSKSTLSNDEFVTVTVTGVKNPSKSDWVAMLSPSNSNVKQCPLSEVYYIQTGDTAKLPLLCHYPVKAQFMKNDPNYLRCRKGGCSGSLKFHVVNIRSDIEFAFFSGGYLNPCLVARSNPIKFENPKMPLYGHLSSIDSTGTSMRLTWVSGDNKPQQIQYGDGKKVTSGVTTFSKHDMCRGNAATPSPAKDFGWHDPGYIHSAVMTGLKPSNTFSYRYGSDSVGWSEKIQFSTPPAGGSSEELRFITYGDMGKTPLDQSDEHYIQPGALSVVKAITDDVKSNKVKSIFHIGDISYATGFLVEWDYFLQLISPIASKLPYMTAIGNHERDYKDSGSVYSTPDSGGECGVPYEKYFPMPVAGKDKPWYSIEQASVHFTIISTENDWSPNSEQYQWIQKDMASVNRQKTPWLVFMGHRQMYKTGGFFYTDKKFVDAVEPLLLKNKVDLVLFGHVHNYERTCSIYQSACFALPKKDANGVDTYDHRNYTAPVHAIIGMAGFSLDKFPDKAMTWSLKRISEFGYLRGHATRTELKLEFVNSITRKVLDTFRIIK